MSDLKLKRDYQHWLSNLKKQFHQTQLKAIVQVNGQLLEFYWQLGADIVLKQQDSVWGDGFLAQLSQDLMAEFPSVKGFSLRNIKYIRQWYTFYSQTSIGQQAVAQLFQIPWGHNLKIIAKCNTIDEALYYVQNTQKYSWSRSVLTHQIESELWQREGKAISNFKQTLPEIQSDLAQQTLKDPYIFDFLSLTKGYKESELEKELIKHLESFLLELGQGFAFVGRQYHLSVGEQDFYADLLFYHLELRCFMVIELKTGDFKPEYAGKINFYCSAIDEQLKKDNDNPTIGLILCKRKNKIIAEYSLRDVHQPIGISEYELTQALPEEFQSSLPSIDQLEAELSRDLK